MNRELNIGSSIDVETKKAFDELMADKPELKAVADKYEALGNSLLELLRIVVAQNEINEMIADRPELKAVVDEHEAMGKLPTEILKIINEEK